VALDEGKLIDSLSTLVGGWVWWQATIAIFIFIVALRLPAIINAASGYRKVRIEGENRRREIESRMAARQEKKKRKTAKTQSMKGGDT
jgi:energy-converting hydrogenase Eha subunit H